MKMVILKKEWVILVFCLIMPTVSNKSKKLMDSVSLESEIHGVKVNGLVNLLTKTKLGMIIKD